MPPLRGTGFTDLMAAAARTLGWHPFPGPAAINSRVYENRSGCMYHGFCNRGGCHVDAKGSTAVTTIPKAQATGRLKVVTRAHVTTIDSDGVQCECGNIGCLDTVASAPNIVRRARERLDRDSTSSLSRLAAQEEFTAADLAHEATNGYDFSIMMIERTGKYIGAAVAGIINLLSIQTIVLGGAVMEAGAIILNPIIKEAGERSFQPCFESTKIVVGELGADAIPIGAALLASCA